jgi:hypothetical protein
LDGTFVPFNRTLHCSFFNNNFVTISFIAS